MTEVRWLKERVVLGGVEYIPGWVNIVVYPELLPYCERADNDASVNEEKPE